ncbi:hypothetical protein Ancab_009899 [Ancistrocladus abbreviatus]
MFDEGAKGVVDFLSMHCTTYACSAKDMIMFCEGSTFSLNQSNALFQMNESAMLLALWLCRIRMIFKVGCRLKSDNSWTLFKPHEKEQSILVCLRFLHYE